MTPGYMTVLNVHFDTHTFLMLNVNIILRTCLNIVRLDITKSHTINFLNDVNLESVKKKKLSMLVINTKAQDIFASKNSKRSIVFY